VLAGFRRHIGLRAMVSAHRTASHNSGPCPVQSGAITTPMDVPDPSGATGTGVTPDFAIEPAAPASGYFGVVTTFTG
jgi:hypothetical protein